MYRIALNVAISFYRRESVRARHVLPGSEHMLEAMDETGDRSEDVEMLYQWIEELDPLNKALVILYLDGNNYQRDRGHHGNQPDQRRNQDQPAEADDAGETRNYSMELDELKEKWAEHDRKLDESIRLNRQLLREFLHATGQICAVEIGGDAGRGGDLHAGRGRFARPLYRDKLVDAPLCMAGYCLDLMAIAALAALIVQIGLALNINYNQPVALIQKRLETLRKFRIRYIQAICLTMTLTWTPIFIVGMKASLGRDVYRLFDTTWIVANVAFGFLVFGIGIWVARRYGDRMSNSAFGQRFLRDLAGYNLNAASGFLTTLAEFEKD